MQDNAGRTGSNTKCFHDANIILASIQAGQIMAGIYLELSFSPDIRTTLADDISSGDLALFLFLCYCFGFLFFISVCCEWLLKFTFTYLLNIKKINLMEIFCFQEQLWYTYASHVMMKPNDWPYKHWNC